MILCNPFALFHKGSRFNVNGRFTGGGGLSGNSDSAAPSISVSVIGGSITLQTSNYWFYENIWNPGSLTRGTYTSISGSTYEIFCGVDQPALSVSTTAGHAPAALRMKWGFPIGSTEVKGYPALIAGEKPGWANVGPKPGGIPVLLPDGTTSTVAPSGPTPNDFFPIALSSLSAGGGATCFTTFRFTHNETPIGKGHLSYDIWLTSSAIQGSGFSAPPVCVELMIPLTYWGFYGAYVATGGGRNPSWYNHDVTIQGRLWHVFNANSSAGAIPFNGEWNFVVFEPDNPASSSFYEITSISSLDLSLFIQHMDSVGYFAGWTSTEATATHMVAVELGVEPVNGTGDLTVYNFTVKP